MTNSECWVIKLWLVLWAFPSPLHRVLWGFGVFLLNGATSTLIVKVFRAVLFRRPYKWIGKCYWLSHKRVLVNMCEPSCEKSKQCALASHSTVFTGYVCVFFFFLLCFYLNASSHRHYYIKARIKKIPTSRWSHPSSGCVNSPSVIFSALSSVSQRDMQVLRATVE